MANAQRMGWLRHVVKLEDLRTAKRILLREISGIKRRGRSRIKWLQAVEGYLKKKTEWKKQ